MSAPLPAENDLLPAPLRLALPYALLALAIFTVYAGIFDNAFLFDDDLLIQLDGNLRGWNHIGDILTGSTTSGAMIAGGFYRPVQILLYLIVFQLGQGSTVGFHLLNLCIHTGNACFAYRLGTKMGFKLWGTFLASLLWAVHPLHTEAVTYMSGTADPLFAFFCLWSVVYLTPDFAPAKIFKIIPLFLLGLFSKETSAMLPLLVCACLFYSNPERLRPRTYLRTWPLWLITALYVAWRMQAKGLDGPQTYARLYQMHAFATLKLYADHFSYRLYTFFATLPAYLKLMVWPTGLHMERAFSIFEIPLCPTCNVIGPVLTGMVMVALACLQIVYSAVKSHSTSDGGKTGGMAMAWGLLWFGAAHAPDSGLLIPMNSLFLEHWMYLPMIGLLLGAGETLTYLFEMLVPLFEKRARVLAICASGIIFLFILTMARLTYAQNAIWHDPASFYNNIFAYGEQSARAHNNLALYYSDKGNYDDAVTQFKKAIEISDSYAETRHNLALTYLRMSDQRSHLQEAIDNLNRALGIDPNFYRSYITLGDIYGALGDTAKAQYYRDRAEQIIAQRH